MELVQEATTWIKPLYNTYSMKHPQPHSEDLALNANGRRRCVVLLGSDGAVPSWLVRGLDQHGADSVLANGPAAVMVELARAQTHAVVFDRPQGKRQLDELLAAIDTYYPQVVCWSHEAGTADHRPRLHRLSPPKSTSSVIASVVDQCTPKEVATAPPESSTAECDREADAALLTQEELAMLLGPAEARLANETPGEEP